MKINLHCALGYKVCYNKQGNNKTKKHIITNTYGLAEFEKKICERYKIIKDKNKRFVKPTKWFILPLGKKESKYAWRKCPY